MQRSWKNTCRLWSRMRIGNFRMLAGILLIMFCLQISQTRADENSAPTTTKQPTSKAEQRPTLQSGPEIGSTIHQFFVRAVTGPHRNRSVCYVCRYGSRPVVMVLLQKSDPQIALLLKEIDRIVDENRVSGLRSFGVLVTDESARAVPILQTMAFDEKIRMPLTAATTAIAGTSCHNLHEDAATTVILYREQQAVNNFAFTQGEISERSIRPLLESIEELIEPAKSE